MNIAIVLCNYKVCIFPLSFHASIILIVALVNISLFPIILLLIFFFFSNKYRFTFYKLYFINTSIAYIKYRCENSVDDILKNPPLRIVFFDLILTCLVYTELML